MFTGIVSEMGEVVAVKPHAANLQRIKIACAIPRSPIADGASISCSGVCMTVVGSGQEDGHAWFAVDAAAETLAVTTVGRWKHGMRINIERSLQVGDELGGHMVSGHIDGLATVIGRENMTEMARLALRAPAPLARFIAPKGSVALDGVSLTVNAIEDDTFSVLIIPHTMKVTTLGNLRTGEDVNLEIDQMARYAARLMESR